MVSYIPSTDDHPKIIFSSCLSDGSPRLAVNSRSLGELQRSAESSPTTDWIWFLDPPEYIAWHKAPDMLMWLHELPGAGKTVLCSTVIEDIKQRNELSGETNEGRLQVQVRRFQNCAASVKIVEQTRKG